MEILPYAISKKQWVITTSLGWLLGIVLVLLLSGIFEATGIEGLQFFMGAGMGAGVGFAQWRLLRKAIHMGSRWMWYSIFGLAAPFLCLDLLKIMAGLQAGNYYILYSICIAGLLAGALQYSLLKRHSPKASQWMIGSLAGWGIATLTFLTINYSREFFTNNWVLFSVNLAVMLGAGPVLGIVSGTSLLRILKHRRDVAVVQ